MYNVRMKQYAQHFRLTFLYTHVRRKICTAGENLYQVSRVRQYEDYAPNVMVPGPGRWGSQ